MGNAIWLILALPTWFVSACIAPFLGIWNPLLIGVPIAGAAALVAGVVLGVLRRNARLLLFLVPPILSEALVAVAGVFRGKLADRSGEPVILGVLAAELAVCLALIAWLRGARLPAALLTVFCVTYALFAGFVAAMAFEDSWI